MRSVSRSPCSALTGLRQSHQQERCAVPTGRLRAAKDDIVDVGNDVEAVVHGMACLDPRRMHPRNLRARQWCQYWEGNKVNGGAVAFLVESVCQQKRFLPDVIACRHRQQ